MMKKDKSSDYSPEPILAINEFEEAAGAILDLAQDQAARNIQEAKEKADEVVQQAHQSFSILEKGRLAKMVEDVEKEKERLTLKIKGELKRIEDIPEARIKQAVGLVLEKVLPKEV